MSIQLVVQVLLLITFFILLAHFEHSFGPVKLRIKDIQRHSDEFKLFNTIDQLKPQTQQPIFNNPFENIIDSIAINETDYEDKWDNRNEYWLHNLGN